MLADLCKVLDLSQPHRVAARITDDMKGRHPITTLGGAQEMVIVSEPGMYEVVIRSDKPEAAAFRRWITSEVLPAIRKTGGYGVPQLSGPALMAAALVEADQVMRALSATVDDQRARLAIAAPKAAAFDRWMGSGADYSIDVAAKALSTSGYLTGRNRLFAELAEIGWAYRDGSGWHPYQQHGPEGTRRLTVRVFYFDHPDTGEAKGKSTLRITAKGVADLAKLHGILPGDIHGAVEATEDAAA